MQQPLGEMVRQLRRLRNLTQQELAGDRYSKSYVSGVEHNRINPSAEALRFMASRLGQPDGNFSALLQQPDIEKALSVLDMPFPATNGCSGRDETIALLSTLLEQSDPSGFSSPQQLPTIAPETLAMLPPPLQARYSFLMGCASKAQGDLASALRAFETALVLAPFDQQAAILDEIGNCCYLRRAYHTALGYHLHALRLLQVTESLDHAALWQVTIDLHCGDDYLAIGAYQQALAHYESARTHLSTRHDLATTGKVYTGLGYLTFVVLPQTNMPSAHAPHLSPDQIEHDYQLASSFLQQGVGFYQASRDRLQEANAHLTLASLLLDWSVWRRQTRYGQTDTSKKKPSTRPPTPLLDEAQVHCRQVLLTWQDSVPDAEASSAELNFLFSTAIACLIRIAVQHAIHARLGHSSLDTAYRQRALAAYLCRLVLETLSSPTPIWSAVHHVVTLSADSLVYSAPTLPHFTDLPESLTQCNDPSQHRSLGLVEVYSALGEVAEELGRVAATPTHAHDCYATTNQYLHAALTLASRLHICGACDPGALSRLYQRWIALLQERATETPATSSETTQALARLLEQGFWQFQCLHPHNAPHTR
jgi:transcriptional regulator with XRE-family HTH domain